MRYFSILTLAIVGQMSSNTWANDLPQLSQSQFHQCLDNLKNSKNFRDISSVTFENHRPSRPDSSVIRSLNYQPEFKKDVWDYLSSLVDSERVEDGIRAKREQSDVLRRIESRYGVRAEHVLGVWGVESNFGQTLGQKNLFDSLATLSCFGRRQNYFRGEFANALKIVQNGDIRPEDMKGSWAGAFGQTQFMPSTFLSLAVDFDGDGRKDLVNSQADALASTANFLVKSGYRSNEPWGYEVKINGYTGVSGRRNKKSMAYWRSVGITLPDGRKLPDDMASAGLLLPTGSLGPAFLVGRNFDAFYAYNASENYALAIAHLSDLIAQENTNTDFVTAWPTDDAGISRRQAKEIQQALLDAGYDIGNVDGIIGDNTRRAIMDYQQKHGIKPNGRAGQQFYRLIMSHRTSKEVVSQQPVTQKQPQPQIQSSKTKKNSDVPSTPAIQTPNRTVYHRVINSDGSVSLVPSEEK